MFIIGVVLALIFFFFVLKQWSEGVFETSEGFLLVLTGCGLIFGLFAARETWQFLLAAIPLAAASGYAIYSYRIGSIQAYYRRRCQEYMASIIADPRNLGAREHLADVLYNLGELNRAIDELQVAVNMGAGIESRNKLSKWIKQRNLQETTNPVCRWCSTENAADARTCRSCGADLPFENPLAKWLVGGRSSMARYYLIIVFGLALVSMSVAFCL